MLQTAYLKWNYTFDINKLNQKELDNVQNMIASTSFSDNPIKKLRSIKGKSVYSPTSNESKFILNACNQIIKSAYYIRPSNKTEIIKTLKNFISGSSHIAVYRLDIKGFFENCNIKNINELISDDNRLDDSVKKFLLHFLSLHAEQGLRGLPRGLAISSTLSEYCFSNFDHNIKNKSEVLYYARFVDDICLIIRHDKNLNQKKFMGELANQLPVGLEFNKKKQKIIVLENINNNNTNFDYLGYNFKLSQKKNLENPCSKY
ncbi:hypothetical protein GKC56_00125 [Neisseriaceae bacterium PsAf]|nr:hypothetical protein [Neisseriaceae bacterium PsAf]